MPNDLIDFKLRPATVADLPSLNNLISLSIEQFCSKNYTLAQTDAIIHQATAGRYDYLITQSTYFVISNISNPEQIAACGGWTPHRTIYSSNGGSKTAIGESSDPQVDPAWIRGVYVHPESARKGFGKWIMRACEEAAWREGGFDKFELASTTNAVRLYEACGYRVTSGKLTGLPGGEIMEVVMMHKGLGQRSHNTEA